MRLALIGDIHGNLEALEAALEAIEGEGTDGVFCLGDVVGYGPNPNECVSTLRERGIPCLLGNHDAAACSLEAGEDFNPVARAALDWTRASLSAEHREYLSALPERTLLPDGGPLLVHGSPLHRDDYLFNNFDALPAFQVLEARNLHLCFFAHTHIPSLFVYRALADFKPVGEVFLDPGDIYLVNGGGVGQPRDHDPRAGFVIFDDQKYNVRFHRVDYPIELTANKILAAGLPMELATRLYFGL